MSSVKTNILRHPVWNEWLFRMCQTDSAILQLHWTFPNGLFNYIQACIFSWFKLLFNVYARGLFTGKILAPNLTSHTIMALLSRTSSIYENVFFIPSLFHTVEFTSASCYKRPAPRIIQKLLLTGPGFQIGNPRCHHFYVTEKSPLLSATVSRVL